MRTTTAAFKGSLAIGALCAALLVGACKPQSGAGAQASGPRQVVEDPKSIRAEVSLDRAELTTAQRLTLTIDTRIRDGFDARAADVQGALPENWTIAEDRTLPVGASDGWRSEQRIVVIEPFLDGHFTIGSLQIIASPRADGDPVTLTTAPMDVFVRSVLADDSEATLAAVKTVVEPPAPNRAWIWVAVSAGSIALVALVAWIVIRKRRPGVVEPLRRAAHELAIERLSALLSAGLVERGEFKEFYARASLILRRYIEDRFGLHAPKQTTEEFLAASRVSLALSRDDVAGLESFLRACDEIKFAAGAATPTQAHATANAVRDFVERTGRADSLVVVEPSEEQQVEAAA